MKNHSYYRYMVYKYYVLYKKTKFKFLKYLYYYKYSKASLKINVQINCDYFLKNFTFNHANICIHKKSIIGENLFCVGNNCIGGSNKGYPRIGNNVTMGYGSIVIGNVQIANNVTIGAGAIVTKDILIEGSTVIGVNKILEKRELL